ncbi:pyruvate dehydrogenase (acetyl-transferring) E1 component subunit alpha [Rummeliibacillus pycnus]|uniref:pyruvate dehydrogenase (acetyl-transferring) E1 component subunit alpha n=1 Tax=Rummeliibacillus pycnus TaxID=101070 RepID=UPI0037C58BCC
MNETTYKVEQYSVLNSDGEIINGRSIQVNDRELLEMYRLMKRARLLDEKLLRLQRQGRICTYPPFSGQEAAQIGSGMALNEKDWICPSYRDLAACLVRGMSIESILMYVKGYASGWKMPENTRILPIQVIIAAQLLHAAGIAHAAKIKGEDSVTVSYFGDGATSQGDFHEALNFASVFKSPVIFFCQNNQYAISIPVYQQMASATIAQKAIAYDIPGIQVDGNDVIAVYQVMKEAIKRAREGRGPTLIEAVTYRQGPHTTSDEPKKYRTEEETKKWLAKDPLLRLQKYLKKKLLLSDELENQILQQTKKEIENAIHIVDNTVPDSLDTVLGNAYKNPHLLLQEQIEYCSKKRGITK